VNPVDKRRVRAAFSRAAGRYDAHAAVQARVRERALALAAAAAPGARRVLDVGSGTGALLAALAAARPGLRAAAVDLAPGMCAATRAAAPGVAVAAADAEALPFAAGSFDLVVSTSTLQWVPRLGPALAEVRRVLAPGGVACLALFGERTLHELRAAWRAAAGPGAPDRTHRFSSRDALDRALAGAGLAADVEEEELVERHADARAVLRALKALGASSAVPAPGGARGLGGRAETLELLRRYDAAHGGPAGVPATYHALYAVARPAARAFRSPSPRAPSAGPAAPSRAGSGG
jgi:malonyl-CoA O-methyltransferase